MFPIIDISNTIQSPESDPPSDVALDTAGTTDTETRASPQRPTVSLRVLLATSVTGLPNLAGRRDDQSTTSNGGNSKGRGPADAVSRHSTRYICRG